MTQTRCHLSVLVHKQAEKYGDRVALIYKGFGDESWKDVTWKSFSFKTKQVSNALLSLGIKPQEKIGVFSQNCKEHLYTNFGAYGIRAIAIPFYATNSEQQIQQIVQDAEIKLLFVGEQEQYGKVRRIFPLCESLERIIIYDNSVRISSHDPHSIYFSDFISRYKDLPYQDKVELLYREASMDDICDILYTSGTSGDSKGVILTYGQYDAGLKANDKCVPVGENDRVISFLPFTHILERAWSYLSMSEGARIIINTYPKEIQQSMRETNPTSMASVPRFWEKVYIGVKDKMDQASGVRKKLFEHALHVGKRHNVEYIGRGKRPPLSLRLEYQMLNRTVLSLVRKQLGLEKPNIFPTAGATVSKEVEEFVHSIGIDMIVGYGLTESLATVSCDHKNKAFTVGSVGRLIDGIDIKIAESNEVCLRGKTITKGYYNRPHLNKNAFDEEGYFHTGDAGYIKDGELFLTDRIKDLYKTSNGKYIAPQAIEALLLVDKYIDQIAVIADERPFVSALIVPDYQLLEDWAKEQGIGYRDREELCSNHRVYNLVFERIKTLQQQLAPYEQIKRITLLAHHFDMDNGELTSTLKLCRSVIRQHYTKEIEDMYK